MCEGKEYYCSQCGCSVSIDNYEGDPQLLNENDLICEDCKFEYEKEIREQELPNYEENDDNEFF